MSTIEDVYQLTMPEVEARIAAVVDGVDAQGRRTITTYAVLLDADTGQVEVLTHRNAEFLPGWWAWLDEHGEIRDVRAARSMLLDFEYAHDLPTVINRERDQYREWAARNREHEAHHRSSAEQQEAMAAKLDELARTTARSGSS
jgi:hypothetical protein